MAVCPPEEWELAPTRLKVSRTGDNAANSALAKSSLRKSLLAARLLREARPGLPLTPPTLESKRPSVLHWRSRVGSAFLEWLASRDARWRIPWLSQVARLTQKQNPLLTNLFAKAPHEGASFCAM